MKMSFWWDYHFTNFLFAGYNISTLLYFVLSCFAVFVVALFFEFIKMLHAKVKQRRMMMVQRQLRSICPTESDTLLIDNPGPSTSNAPQRPPTFVITTRYKIIYFIQDMGLWLSQNVVGYLLMLTVMLYNGYMVICIVVGSALGYFLFGPTLMKINIQTCRALRSTFCMADCGEPDKTALLGPRGAPEGSSGDTSPPACHSVNAAIISETTADVVHPQS